MSTISRSSTSRSSRATSSLIAIALTIGALVTAFPFIWMLASAFKPTSESVAYPPALLPRHPTLLYLGRLFSELDFGKYFANTMGVVLIGVVGLLFTAMAG